MITMQQEMQKMIQERQNAPPRPMVYHQPMQFQQMPP